MIIVTPHSYMLDIQGLESGPPDYQGTKTVFTLVSLTTIRTWTYLSREI